jgi:hypothetical protein
VKTIQCQYRSSLSPDQRKAAFTSDDTHVS